MGLVDDVKNYVVKDILEIEKRTDISDDEKISKIINAFAVACAAIAIQSIPFADYFILTPMQAFMGKKIADIRGYDIGEKGVEELIKEIGGVAGLGLVAQQVALGAYKVGLPFLAGFTTIPLVYGLTYGIGRVMDTYFKMKIRGETINPQTLKDIYKQAKKEGKDIGKKSKSDVQNRGKLLK